MDRQPLAQFSPPRGRGWLSGSQPRRLPAACCLTAASPGRRSHVPFSPLAQLEEARSHRAATFGQLVDDAQRRTIEHPPIDQAGLG